MGCILSLCRSFGICFGIGGGGGGGAEEATLVSAQEFAREEPADQQPSSSATDDVMNKASIILKDLKESSNTDNFFNSINEYLKEAQSRADLLLEAVNRFENGEQSSSVFKSLKEYKSQRNDLLQKRTFMEKLESQREQHESRIKNLLELVQYLERKLGWVSRWQVVGTGVYCVATVALLVSSALFVIISRHQAIGMKDFDLGHKAFARLDGEISGLLGEYKSSLKGKKDTAVDQLNQTFKKLSIIRALMEETCIAIKKVDDIIACVYEHVEVYIKSVNDEEAMCRIKTGAERLKTIVEDLKKDISLRRDKLNTEVETVLKGVKKSEKDSVCRCCSADCC